MTMQKTYRGITWEFTPATDNALQGDQRTGPEFVTDMEFEGAVWARDWSEEALAIFEDLEREHGVTLGSMWPARMPIVGESVDGAFARWLFQTYYDEIREEITENDIAALREAEEDAA